jgi:hypothetical protein
LGVTLPHRVPLRICAVTSLVTFALRRYCSLEKD